MVEIKRRTLKDVDWALIIAPVGLTLFGCVGIYSTAPNLDFVKKQVIFLVIGLVVATVAMLTDYRRVIADIAPFFYGFVLVLLVFVLFVGEEINGNKAWLRIPGLFGFQPSEFAKLATILMLARYMARPRSGPLSLRDMAVMAAIVIPPVLLIHLENDTGTMLTFGAILGAFYFLGGLKKRWIAAGVIGVALALVAVYPYLKEYQRKRIDIVLHPENADPRGYGFQTIQSMVAVGSGGVLGKGIGQGTQGKLGFLPYAYSDFIGAAVAEETGLIGVLLMMALYLTLIFRLFVVALGARDRAGSLVIMGLIALITFHIACNLGMVVGLMPIMGIPLPLMSAGGTAVITIFAGVGIALSVRLRRFVN
jgi:rod shape determining protein RodA